MHGPPASVLTVSVLLVLTPRHVCFQSRPHTAHAAVWVATDWLPNNSLATTIVHLQLKSPVQRLKLPGCSSGSWVQLQRGALRQVQQHVHVTGGEHPAAATP